MTFSFCRLRFHFRAIDSLYFPPGKTGNLIRGAFGLIFRRLACLPECAAVGAGGHQANCPYARVFEPRATRGEAPSGLRDWPRPFLFRARHLDGLRIAREAGFWFDVHLFDATEPPIEPFVLSFAQLAVEGIGPRRGRAWLLSADQLDTEDNCVATVYNPENAGPSPPGPPSVLDLTPWPSAPRRVRVRFLSPTELKSVGLATEPEFPVLFGRLRDRISTLRALYGEGPLPLDFQAMGERAKQVRMIGCDIHREESQRRSGRTGQTHSIGGFTGEADYEGELAEFLPFLAASRWTGVGRQTVWGKGELSIEY